MIPARLGAFIAGCAGPVLLPEERAFFADAQPLGFILFARNLEDADQIRALCADLRDAVGWDAPILIDQEGGRVARLRPPLVRDWVPPLQEVARAGRDAAEVMFLRYAIIGAELRGLGIDTNCAPCADVARPDTHPVLRNRCYGDDPAVVASMARAVADGMLSQGVLPVLKHIPGHGAATVDSHLDLPTVSLDAGTLDAVDFAPFRALADLPLGMSAHIVFEAMGETGPATTSPAMIARIRDQIGFKGLLMTDDISMQALAGGMADRARAAIKAGCDLVLHCNGDLTEMREIAGASGPLSPESHARADAGLALRGSKSADLRELNEQWDALMARIGHG